VTARRPHLAEEVEAKSTLTSDKPAKLCRHTVRLSRQRSPDSTPALFDNFAFDLGEALFGVLDAIAFRAFLFS
jgi:hypothetical protein